MRAQDRLLSILVCVGQKGPLTLTEVAARVEVPRPTVQRILRDLEVPGWVVRDPSNAYRLGPAVVSLAQRYLSGSPVIAVAGPHMAALRDEVKETVSLSTCSGNVRYCVAEYASPFPLRYVHEVGTTAPMHSGASGRALLACLDDEAIAEILSKPLERYTDATWSDPAEFWADIAITRKRGWAISLGERYQGAVAVAVPLKDPVAGTPYSLAVFAPEARATPRDTQRWVGMLKACAQSMILDARGVAANATTG